MLGVVPRDYDALERALAAGIDDPAAAVADPDPPPTVLAKIAHVVPPDGAELLAAMRAVDGRIVSVADEEALETQRRFGAVEGLFVEPSTAAGLAGLERAIADGTIAAGETVVVLLTGSGFREASQAPRTRALIALDELGAVLGAAC
jgi:threonine synthase